MVRHDGPDDTIPPTDEISLFELGTSLLRNRRRIVTWKLIGAVLTVAVSLFGRTGLRHAISPTPKPEDPISLSYVEWQST